MKTLDQALGLGWVIILLSSGGVFAQSATDSTCEPQPDCQILYSPLIPGAPTPGINNKGYVIPKDYEAVIPNDLRNAQAIDRNTYRLPNK